MARNNAKTDVIQFEDQFYIRAESSLADARTLVLLHNDTFAIFDCYGDIQPVGLGQQGLFHEETRYLSRLELKIRGHKPLLLSSVTGEDNVMVTVDLTNPDMELPSGELLPRGTLHIYRNKFLTDGSCLDQITVHNFGRELVDTELSFGLGADFKDIFEVRGQKRDHRGRHFPEETERGGLVLSYEGLDKVLRRTRIQCSGTAALGASGEITVPVRLELHQEMVFSLNIYCECNTARRDVVSFEEALLRIHSGRKALPLTGFDIYTSNEQFNDWLNRSRADLTMMLAHTNFGLYPYAGVFPSSAPSLAATESSPRWSCYGSFLKSRKACCHIWQLLRRHTLIQSEMPNPARFCTRPAKGRWRGSEKSHSGSTTAA